MEIPAKSRRLVPGSMLVLAIFMGACKNTTSENGDALLIPLKSSAFKDGGRIPFRYTCDGSNVSPPLAWGEVPERTQSLVVACEDFASYGSYKHWGLFNLPPDLRELPENVPTEDALPNGGCHARNSNGTNRYFGPCPPSYESKPYHFKIYALDTKLDFPAGTSMERIFLEMEGHILKRGILVGIYR
jgi:Raf kinase inhibitor-like YbhB/YbcL family protein